MKNIINQTIHAISRKNMENKPEIIKFNKLFKEFRELIKKLKPDKRSYWFNRIVKTKTIQGKIQLLERNIEYLKKIDIKE